MGEASGYSIDHLGIAVSSIEQALEFWERALGLKASPCAEAPEEGVRLVMLDTGSSRIELLEPAAPESAIGRFLARRGGGLHHVALRVPDLAAAVTRLKQTGARLLNDPRPGAGGHLYVFIHPASTGGVLIELIQETHT